MYLQEPLKVLQGKGEKEMSLVPNNPPQTMVFTMHCRYSHLKGITHKILHSMSYNILNEVQHTLVECKNIA